MDRLRQARLAAACGAALSLAVAGGTAVGTGPARESPPTRRRPPGTGRYAGARAAARYPPADARWCSPTDPRRRCRQAAGYADTPAGRTAPPGTPAGRGRADHPGRSHCPGRRAGTPRASRPGRRPSPSRSDAHPPHRASPTRTARSAGTARPPAKTRSCPVDAAGSRQENAWRSQGVMARTTRRHRWSGRAEDDSQGPRQVEMPELVSRVGCDAMRSCLPPETGSNAVGVTNRTNLDLAGVLGGRSRSVVEGGAS
jgi:hypothetical protein